MDSVQPIRAKPIIIGHRGDFYRKPENTTEGFQSAFNAGADAVELDVHLTQDNIPVVYHDDFLGGAGFHPPGAEKPKRIGEYTLAQLKQASFDAAEVETTLSKYVGQPVQLKLSAPPQIPTLDEVLVALPPGKQLYIELKRPTFSLPNDGLEEAVVKWIRDHQLHDRVTVISFNRKSILKIKQLAPEVSVGLVTLLKGRVFQSRFLRDLVANNIESFLPNIERTTKAMVEACHQLGLKIIPWIFLSGFKQEQLELKGRLDWGLDGIITNQPGFLSDSLKKEPSL